MRLAKLSHLPLLSILVGFFSVQAFGIEAVTNPVGVLQVTALGDSDTLISIPLKQPAVFNGVIGGLTADTLKKPLPGERAQGGPVESGKPYVVGEKGPEIIIPTSDGNVLSNDDSQIFNMLLASNPQLQKVSRQRAERVLRNRFPEYFEG